MSDAFLIQLNDPQMQDVPFPDRFGMIVDAEYTNRKNNSLKRIIKSASFDQPEAHIAAIDYTSGRKLNRALIERLATCEYIAEHRNIFITGATGSGKTYMACALGMEACKQRFKTKYIRLPDLLEEYAEKSVLPGGKNKVLNKYAAFKVLVLDEWLMPELSKADVEFLLELTERRFDSTSTIFCTLYKREDWVKRLRGGTYAESIVERFAHNTTWVETGDVNMRQYLSHA